MLQKFRPYLIPVLLVILAAGLLVLVLPLGLAKSYAASKQYTLNDVPTARVAIVFGAGLQRDGTPSPVLRDRIETAAKLYQAGKVEKLLMSGDNRFIDYNEPGAMQAYAQRLGVPGTDIVLDYAGRRTYDTCYRARYIFEISSAILITQGYHMPRALVTCNGLGLQSIGVPADLHQYPLRSLAYWSLREVPATTVAFWEVWISRPLPVLGEPEPIFSKNTTVSSTTLLAF